MNDILKLSENHIKDTYDEIIKFHEKYLLKHSVSMPKLFHSDGKYTKEALVLIYLFQGYPNTKTVTKEELTLFIRNYDPSLNDMQQARHLGAQKGWYIASGGRNDAIGGLKIGEYKLITLEEPFPGFAREHRLSDITDWEEIKRQYSFRCATCGSLEGDPHFHWPSVITKLQKAHMNPTKRLVPGNIIPQCHICNKADLNRWEYDDRGRVIKLADASAVKTFSSEVRNKLYKILYDEFKGQKLDK